MGRVSYQWSRTVDRFWNMEYLNRKKRERGRYSLELALKKTDLDARETAPSSLQNQEVMGQGWHLLDGGVGDSSHCPPKDPKLDSHHKWKHLWESSGVHLRNLSKQHKGTKSLRVTTQEEKEEATFYCIISSSKPALLVPRGSSQLQRVPRVGWVTSFPSV